MICRTIHTIILHIITIHTIILHIITIHTIILHIFTYLHIWITYLYSSFYK